MNNEESVITELHSFSFTILYWPFEIHIAHCKILIKILKNMDNDSNNNYDNQLLLCRPTVVNHAILNVEQQCIIHNNQINTVTIITIKTGS